MKFIKGNIPWNKGKKTGIVPKTAFKNGSKVNLGRIQSLETKQKISEALMGRIAWNKGLTKNNDERVSLYSKKLAGLKKSLVSREKMSNSKKGKPTWWNKKLPSFVGKSGKDSPTWKGNGVGYSGLHEWVRKELSKPDTCEFCGTNGLSGRKIHWANKSGKYKRSLEDWLRLCVLCHGTYDRGRRDSLAN